MAQEGPDRKKALIKAKLKVRIEHWRKGELLWSSEKEEDLLVDAARNYLCEVVGNPTQPANMGYTAIGTDNTPPAVGQAALLAEVMRVANSYTKDAPTGQASLDASFTIDGTYTLNEMGLFNDPSAGIMYCRDLISPARPVLLNDTINVFYTLTFSAV